MIDSTDVCIQLEITGCTTQEHYKKGVDKNRLRKRTKRTIKKSKKAMMASTKNQKV
jgi:hypothetical protein